MLSFDISTLPVTMNHFSMNRILHRHTIANIFTLLLMSILVLNLTSLGIYYYGFTQPVGYAAAVTQSAKGPIINNNTDLKAEVVFTGLKFPTSMAFLGPNDILVLEKNNGTVQRIVNGIMLKNPLLDVNVANKGERGMLGIAIAPKHEKNKPTYVFLYYTESKTKDGEDSGDKSIDPLGNRLYRYELADNNTKLVNPKLLLDLPATPGPFHNGGRTIIGPDNNVYLSIGDVEGHINKVRNFGNGKRPDGSGGILRITQDGKSVKGIIGNKFPLNIYYAYGIRNSFGLDFDPLSGILWDTENGETFGDEINLVKPGFNSGWMKVQGVWETTKNGSAGNVTLHPDELVNFGGKGKYSSPEFVWKRPVGPTAIQFLDSDKLGKKYKNGLVVGDFHEGNLYYFDLNKNRTDLSLRVPLEDKVVNRTDELRKGGVILGKGFGGITDLQVGPDGYLYVLSIYSGGGNCRLKDPRSGCIAYSSPVQGTIFRIVPMKLPITNMDEKTISR
jgi:glucose/arabinose dehydrogenase